MTVCLPVCLLAELHLYYWFDLHEDKKSRWVLGKFRSHLILRVIWIQKNIYIRSRFSNLLIIDTCLPPLRSVVQTIDLMWESW